MILSVFISGAFMMVLAFIGLYFFRFWRDTGDRFFFLFAVAFWLLAVERIPLVFWQPWDEARSMLYIARLVAFTVIILAIVDKNRVGREYEG